MNPLARILTWAVEPVPTQRYVELGREKKLADITEQVRADLEVLAATLVPREGSTSQTERERATREAGH